MRFSVIIAIFLLTFNACRKNNIGPEPICDMAKVNAANATKVTITNGVWGTVSSMEGDFMPMIGPDGPLPARGKHCPVEKTIRFYTYTTTSQAVPSLPAGGFYDNFTTQLVKEVSSDANGFFQAELAPGNYSVVIVENEKLYANGLDGQGGINPVIHGSGLTRFNFIMTYKAVF